MKQITLGKDPEITAADHARFEDRDEIRAARMLGDIGAKETFRSFTLALAVTLPDASEAAQLVDLARGYGEQELSMKVVRTAAQHGFILPERGYPLRTPSSVDGGAEAALVLGITREESGFDPKVRSGPGATGMMQLMPGTASVLARRLGYSYSFDKLEDADFNMELGSVYLGQLVGQFDGSYVMAAAAYNAGPGRPTEWSAYCGDPRSSSTDPSDFIECIPFSETRNYVMRVLEATEVYRARLAGGTAQRPAGRSEARRLRLGLTLGGAHRHDAGRDSAVASFSPRGRRWPRSGRMTDRRDLSEQPRATNHRRQRDRSPVDYIDTSPARAEQSDAPSRQRWAGRRVHERAFQTKDLGQDHGGERVRWRSATATSYPPMMQHRDPVAGAGGQGEVVQSDDHRGAGIGARPEPLEDQELGLGIETGHRLVGGDQAGSGGEQPRQQHRSWHARRRTCRARRGRPGVAISISARQASAMARASAGGRSAAPRAAMSRAGMFQATRRSCGM